MYQNCCKKCGSIELFTNVKGSNTGLYCSDCGSWIKWLSKNELRAFNNAKSKEIKAVDSFKQDKADKLEREIITWGYNCIGDLSSGIPFHCISLLAKHLIANDLI